MIYKTISPLIFCLEAEKAHNMAINFLKYAPKTASLFSCNRKYQNLSQNIWGLDFKNPVGMAAGFDKNAEVLEALQNFGFGFVEAGSVTPKAQPGNPIPRIFRLKEDRAIINRLGFNNLGSEVFAKNISNFLPKAKVPIGINIGKNKNSRSQTKDYLSLLDKFYESASYITVNISSPNTKNLRDIQNKENLSEFLKTLNDKKQELLNKTNKNTPILLKIAPDLEIKQQEDISSAVLKAGIDGLIVSNTTIDRNLDLSSKHKDEQGGLSGKPLFEKSNEVLRNMYKFTNSQIPIIAVGGISSADEAYEKIKNGASLVQIYSAFIYEGFGLVNKINKELSQKLKQDGFGNISQAVGTNMQ